MTDSDDVRTRVEDALRRAATSAYAAAHGAIEERDDSDAAPRWRFIATPRVAVTVTVVLALVGAIVVFLPDAMRAAPGLATDVGPSGAPSTAAAVTVDLSAGSVVVHVAGAVTTPGLYTLAGGARVADAVAAAGGSTDGADLDAVNLARVVVDGEQVRVPLAGETTGGDALININQADAATLDELPGVGPVLAERIAEYRDEHGPYASVDALDAVSGVGPVVLEKIRAAATV